ncbi:hypothetical protein MAM1_0044c03073 [Mucor ambiguus]|uniref:H/ACA ribonucleoprotein complex subunit n=1 Tax=Mucor ambiguus TaxID=91626 RepID=A0A0C9MNM6_9FUNG|nr:hypothetical protein MAM1_0044c03073 [Mucor ambiguus]
MGKGGFGEHGGRGGGRGGFRGGRGGGRGGFGRGGFNQGPPAEVVPMGAFVHACEGGMVCKSINAKIPYFNAPIFLENKSQTGKVDEILGPLNEVYFTVKMQEGMIAKSFKADDKVYIGTDILLPIERFLPKPKVVGKVGKGTGQQCRSGAARGGRCLLHSINHELSSVLWLKYNVWIQQTIMNDTEQFFRIVLF